MKLSCIIPSYKDKYLIPTIKSVLESSELGDQLEVIVVLDGYWPSWELVEDPRVRYYHLGENRGMREAINAGVCMARGEFIMRSDEHCMFAPGFDKCMVEAFGDNRNWIMTARRYFLNPKTWTVMDEVPYVDYEKLAIRADDEIPGCDLKFEGQRWRTRDKRRRKIWLDETMAMQGSVWVMPKAWWQEAIVALQTEGYGPLYQDSTEMIFKTWQAGGKLMLNKKTWFAHKHWTFTRTHQYGRPQAYPGWQYALSVWKEYYMQEIRPRWFGV